MKHEQSANLGLSVLSLESPSSRCFKHQSKGKPTFGGGQEPDTPDEKHVAHFAG